MALKEQIKKFQKVFKLDSHHAIERVGITLGVLFLIGALVSTNLLVSTIKASAQRLSNQAIYLASSTTSKTKLAVTTDSVWTSPDHRRALVMMSFEPNAQISYEAKDYQGYIFGSDAKLSNKEVSTAGLRADIYSFGTTGHFGLLLQGQEPIKNQVLSIVMRANRELANKGDSATPDEIAGDDSFLKYDQWRVVVNPGAGEVKTLEELGNKDFDAAKVYYKSVLVEKEKEIRGQLDQSLSDMKTALDQIDADTAHLATTKVDGLFLIPPTPPASMAGDQVIGERAIEAENKPSTLQLVTDHVVAGGVDFDWRNKTLADGYIDELLHSGESYLDFFKAKQQETNDSPTANQALEWRLSNGERLDANYLDSVSSNTLKPLVNIMNSMDSAYSNYLSTKSRYQSDQLMSLLSLDVDLKTVKDNTSKNRNENAVLIYVG